MHETDLLNDYDLCFQADKALLLVCRKVIAIMYRHQSLDDAMRDAKRDLPDTFYDAARAPFFHAYCDNPR